MVLAAGAYPQSTEVNDPYYLAIRYGIETQSARLNIELTHLYNCGEGRELSAVDGIPVVGSPRPSVWRPEPAPACWSLPIPAPWRSRLGRRDLAPISQQRWITLSLRGTSASAISVGRMRIRICVSWLKDYGQRLGVVQESDLIAGISSASGYRLAKEMLAGIGPRRCSLPPTLSPLGCCGPSTRGWHEDACVSAVPHRFVGARLLLNARRIT